MSVDGAEFDKAEFICEAEGIPDPVNFWFLNGIPISSKYSLREIQEHPKFIILKKQNLSSEQLILLILTHVQILT